MDIVFAIPLLWGLYKGFTKGMVLTLASIISLFLGIYCAIRFSNFIGDYLNSLLASPKEYIPLVAFCITFLLVIGGVYFLGKFIEGALSFAMLEWVNKLLGALLGILKWSILMSVCIFILNGINGNKDLLSEESRQKSLLYEPVKKIFPLILPEIQQSTIKKNLEKAATELKSEKEK